MAGGSGKAEPGLVARMVVKGARVIRTVKVGPTPPDGVYRLMGPYNEPADQGKGSSDAGAE